MNAFSRFIKRPLVISLLVIVIGAGVYFIFIKKPTASPETIVAKRGTIVQEVSVTGKTKPARTVDLAFETAGRVKSVNVEIGDKISVDQALVELNSNELYAQLAEAEANLESEKAELDKLKKGTRAEEIAISETELANAKISLNNAKENLIDKIQDSYTKSEDAIRNKVDQYFNNPRGTSPTTSFIIGDSSLKIDIENGRVSAETMLTSWKTSLDKLTIASDINAYLNSAKNNATQVKSFLEKNTLALSSLTAGSNISQTTIDTYRSAVSTARTNVNTALTNLQSAEEDLKTAESAVVLVEKELDLEKAGSTPEQIASQEALVKKAEAGADLIRVKISKNILRSPIDGIVTKQDAKVGEIISANSIVVSIISVGGFELEVNVPEADIAKTKIGDSAKVTLDAFGNDVIFEAKVTKIDPAEIIIEGVATYKATLQFVKENGEIRSGMTANIDILTAKRENVIVIPQRAVISKDGEKVVNLLKSGGAIEEIKIETGLRGSDGNMEIVSGLDEGDNVVVSEINK